MRFRLLVIFSLILGACDQNDDKTQTRDKVPFSLPGAREQVILKNDDGSPRLSVFVDEKTNIKVAEIEYHPNGQPKIHKHFENGILNGESWCYYEDGTPWSLNTFRDGKYDGPWKTWDQNGKLTMDAFYADGMPDGDWLTYYPTGQLNTRGFYHQGEKVGIWSWYNLEGKLVREKDYSKNP
jgi:antitoxin component YwqK of YwqJK toxin-antitoxin module